jgi:protein-disulfide isomerase
MVAGMLTQIKIPYDQYNNKLFQIGMSVDVNGTPAYVVGIQLRHRDSAKTHIIYTFEQLE